MNTHVQTPTVQAREGHAARVEIRLVLESRIIDVLQTGHDQIKVNESELLAGQTGTLEMKIDGRCSFRRITVLEPADWAGWWRIGSAENTSLTM